MLEPRFNRRMGKVIAFGNYTLSWIKSNGEGTPANSYDLSTEWGRSTADRRHNIFVGGFVTLPYNFRINTFVTASSGSPFNITTGRDENGDGTINDRPVDANGRPIGRNADLPSSYYAYLVRPELRDFLQKNYPNGVIAQGPGSVTVNTTLSKTFGFGKKGNNLAQAGQGGQGGAQGAAGQNGQSGQEQQNE